MKLKNVLLEVLQDLKVTNIISPFDNEIIINDRWLLEVDCDGASAVIISDLKRSSGNYKDTHKLIVFSQKIDLNVDEAKDEIRKKILSAIDSFEKVVA